MIMLAGKIELPSRFDHLTRSLGLPADGDPELDRTAASQRLLALLAGLWLQGRIVCLTSSFVDPDPPLF